MYTEEYIPKEGDWVIIQKPSFFARASDANWHPSMDIYDKYLAELGPEVVVDREYKAFRIPSIDGGKWCWEYSERVKHFIPSAQMSINKSIPDPPKNAEEITNSHPFVLAKIEEARQRFPIGCKYFTAGRVVTYIAEENWRTLQKDGCTYQFNNLYASFPSNKIDRIDKTGFSIFAHEGGGILYQWLLTGDEKWAVLKKEAVTNVSSESVSKCSKRSVNTQIEVIEIKRVPVSVDQEIRIQINNKQTVKI